MKIVQLRPGERAPDDRDTVTINTLPAGRSGFSGSLLGGNGESLFATSENSYGTTEEALDAAVAWADGHGVATLYVEMPQPS